MKSIFLRDLHVSNSCCTFAVFFDRNADIIGSGISYAVTGVTYILVAPPQFIAAPGCVDVPVKNEEWATSFLPQVEPIKMTGTMGTSKNAPALTAGKSRVAIHRRTEKSTQAIVCTLSEMIKDFFAYDDLSAYPIELTAVDGVAELRILGGDADLTIRCAERGGKR